MSSLDRSPVRGACVALALTAALMAGGCQVRPLYGTTAVGSASGMTQTLSDVDVAPIDGRVGQKVRNDLLYFLDGGSPGNATYIVNLDVKERYTNVITRTVNGEPGGRNVKLVVDYTLREPGKDVLTEGTVTRIASMDYFDQRFANDRAMIDAEDRAAREVATDIHLQIAAYFATGRSYDEKAQPDDLEDVYPGTGNSIFDDQEPIYGAPDE